MTAFLCVSEQGAKNGETETEELSNIKEENKSK